MKIIMLISMFETSLYPLIFVFGYFSLAFMLYFFAQHSSRLQLILEHRMKCLKGPVPFVYCIRILGFILLGLIPFLILLYGFNIPSDDLGLGMPNGEDTWQWWLLPVVVFLLGSILRPKKGINISFYPQARVKTWTPRVVIINGLSWMIYLLGYEFAFRGYLFFLVLDVVGFLPAMMINCSLYSLSHIPKGAGEAFGSFFLGMLFCTIAYQTNSLLIPLTLHMILAIGNDLKAVQANPEMRFVWKRA